MKKNLNSLLVFLTGLNKNWYFFIWLLTITFVFAQKTKKELYSQKTKTLQEISETNKILKETRNQKKATVGQLNALKKQINSKEVLIESINTEVQSLDEEIAELQMITESMEQDLDDLKEEYGKMVYAASKVSGQYDKLMFLFSSKTFDQMLMRLKYLKYYSETRKDQLVQIEKVKDALLAEKLKMEFKKQRKEVLLNDNINEKKSLEYLKTDKDKIAQELTSKEKELNKELKDKKKALKKLENIIEDLIKKEIAESRKRAEEEAKKQGKTNDKSGDKNKITLTPETKRISDKFEANKGKLNWPLSSGFISQSFGNQPHPVLKHVTINNLGVDIQTNAGQKCRAVFQGKVTAVANVPGLNQIVTIQHGEFMTVYARLIDVKVSVGQHVEAKQEIATVLTDNEGVTELQFQIWQNITNVNPEEWLLTK